MAGANARHFFELESQVEQMKSSKNGKPDVNAEKRTGTSLNDGVKIQKTFTTTHLQEKIKKPKPGGTK